MALVKWNKIKGRGERERGKDKPLKRKLKNVLNYSFSTNYNKGSGSVSKHATNHRCSQLEWPDVPLQAKQSRFFFTYIHLN